MAVTWAVTFLTEGVSSNGKRVKNFVCTPTGTYTTGGDALPISTIGLKRVDTLQQRGGTLINPGFSVELMGTPEAPLIKLYETNNTEVAGAATITGRAFAAYVEGY